MDLEQVKSFISENQEDEQVKEWLQGFKLVNVEDVQNLANENDDLKKWLEGEKDRHLNKGIETFKSKTLPKLIDEEVKKRNPEKQEWEIELEKVKSELEKERNEKKREALKNKALSVATEKKIPTSIIDHFLGGDESETISNLGKFEEAMKTYVDEQVNLRISSSSYTPPSTGDSASGGSSDFLSIIKENQVKR